MHKPDFPRRSLVCGPEDPAWFSRMVRTDGAHGVVHREDRPPPRVDHLSRYIDFTLRVRNRLRAAATSRDRTMAKSPGCRPSALHMEPGYPIPPPPLWPSGRPPLPAANPLPGIRRRADGPTSPPPPAADLRPPAAQESPTPTPLRRTASAPSPVA